MTTLKLDLKILDKLIIILSLFLSSCQTLEIVEISSELEPFENLDVKEFLIPELQTVDPLTLLLSNSFYRPEFIKPKSYSLPVLDFKRSLVVRESIPPNSYKAKEFSLPPMEIEIVPKETLVENNPVISKPKVVTKSPVITKPKVETNKPVNTKPKVVSNKPVITKPKVPTKPVESTLFLDEMDVLVGKSFTIEMDQTGWLYETTLKDLHFENKFYTNDKVLFEFTPQKLGEYLISFVKYTGESKKYTRVKVNAVIDRPNTIKEDSKIVIMPDNIVENLSEKRVLEKALEDLSSYDNPDEIYYKLGLIYFDEGLLKKSKELFEYIYDNYPLSIYYEDAKIKMEYIIDNFLKVR